MDLTEKERAILVSLGLNARQSGARIAETLSLSRQVVSYTLESLEDRGVIRGYYTILNPYKLGYFYYRLFLKFDNIGLEKKDQFIEYCQSHKMVSWVVQHEGEWDFCIIVWATGIFDFEIFLQEVLESFGRYLMEKKISVSTQIYHLKYTFLDCREDPSHLLVGKTDEPRELGEKDLDILGCLTKEGRMGYRQIADQTGLQPALVKRHVEQLQKEDVILGYQVRLDAGLLGYSHSKVFLNLEEHSGSHYDELIKYLLNCIETIYITKAVGMADLEFEVYTPSNEAFFFLLNDLRQTFPDIIKKIVSSVISDEHYINYLPLKK
ncbi:MAG: Lrp/AsnC family transcriptional regulator [Kiritimatiellae bacterium]|nr:Lrp/AsnC family transcriptional regulator [Kiritimatiellia bacterium]